MARISAAGLMPGTLEKYSAISAESLPQKFRNSWFASRHALSIALNFSLRASKNLRRDDCRGAFPHHLRAPSPTKRKPEFICLHKVTT